MNDVPAPPPEPSSEPPKPPAQSQSQPPVPPPLPPTAAPPVGSTPPGQVAPPAPKSGKAVASMVLGIVGLVFLFCGWLFLELPSLIMGILAIVLGHLAKQEIAENPGMEGEGQAKAGFIMGIVGTVLAGLWLIIVLAAAAA